MGDSQKLECDKSLARLVGDGLAGYRREGVKKFDQFIVPVIIKLKMQCLPIKLI